MTSTFYSGRNHDFRRPTNHGSSPSLVVAAYQELTLVAMENFNVQKATPLTKVQPVFSYQNFTVSGLGEKTQRTFKIYLGTELMY